jgi:hypothetical protein
MEDDLGPGPLAAADLVNFGFDHLHGVGQIGDFGFEAPVDDDPGDGHEPQQQGCAVHDPLREGDGDAEHLLTVTHHDQVARRSRRRQGAAQVGGHGDGDHQHLGQFGILLARGLNAGNIQNDADGQKHGRQGVVAHEHGQGCDDQNDNEGDRAHVGLFEPAEHGHGDALVHPGFDKSHGEHQTTHDEPGGIGPVHAGHGVAVDDAGHQGNHPDARRPPWAAGWLRS